VSKTLNWKCFVISKSNPSHFDIFFHLTNAETSLIMLLYVNTLHLNAVMQMVSSSTRSEAESNDSAHKASKKKKGHEQSQLADKPSKTKTLLNRKKVKEHRKKKLKQRTETKRKQSLGQLLMKKKTQHVDRGNTT